MTHISTYLKAEKFLKNKLGYTQKEIIELNREDNLQILRLYNIIRGINKNIKNNVKFENYGAFED